MLKYKIIIERPNTPQKIELVKALVNLQQNNSLFKIDMIESSTNITLKELSKYNLFICDLNVRKLKDSEFSIYTKPKKLKIMQLGHGAMAKYYNLNGNNMNTPNSIYDYIIAPNEYSYELFIESGWSKENIIRSGMPRIHSYKNIDKQPIKDRLEKLLGYEISKNKIHLFVPSWIKYDKSNMTDNKFIYNIDFITEKMKDDDILIIAPHINNNENNEGKLEFVSSHQRKILIIDKINSSFKGENLMLISDYLYTDYSSIIFDFNNFKKTNKKSFLYSPIKDRKQLKKTRSAYEIQYGKWGTLNNKDNSLFKLNSNGNLLDDDRLRFFNYDNEEYAVEKIVEFIKYVAKR